MTFTRARQWLGSPDVPTTSSPYRALQAMMSRTVKRQRMIAEPERQA